MVADGRCLQAGHRVIGWRIRRVAGPNKAIRREKGTLRIHVAGRSLWMVLPSRAQSLPGRYFKPGEHVEYLVRPSLFYWREHLVLAYRRDTDESMRGAGLGASTIMLLAGSFFWIFMLSLDTMFWRDLDAGPAISSVVALVSIVYGGWRWLETWYAITRTRVEDL